ncbi:hypothetical protein [Streptomyces sp. NPDC014793]|uniref:hypothetical protein n=1 Tax=Streptomyces sp. NPDC014793 TaxID=3364914 RepID=UPI0036F52589
MPAPPRCRGEARTHTTDRRSPPTSSSPDAPTLGERLRLPEGLAYRVRTLNEDLRVTAYGDAYIVFDEHENNYQHYA